MNERVPANGRWTDDQVYQLKVIGASFVSWEEAESLGQVLPGRRDRNACKLKWHYTMSKNYWTEEEDDEFLRFRDYRSDWNEAQCNEEWQGILRWMQARGRTEAECDGRWKLYLRMGRAMGGQNIGCGKGMPGPAARK